MKKSLFIVILILFIMIIPFTLSKNEISKTIIKTEKLTTNNNQKILENYGYISGYSCKKITVINEDGTLNGRYNLEDYVVGVVSGETHVLDDEETFKAMSVLARTYALYVTKNCKYSIINSEANQVMDNPKIVSKKIKDAVSKTNGEVLTLNGNLVKSEYDSFYMGTGFYCDYKYCYSTYLKVGDKNPKKQKIKVPASWRNDLSGGHGKGLSQYGSKYLSMQGYDYKKILKYFYADGVKISTIIKPNVDGLEIENNFITRKTRPLRNNKFYYINDVVNKITKEGDSTWYATSRANEILKSKNIEKNFPYLKDSENYCNVSNFNKSYNYEEPHIGSIISYGKHLAIIENVHDDMVDITEAYIGLGYYKIEFANEYLNETGMYYNAKTNSKDRKYNCEKNGSGCFKRTNNIKISELKSRWGYDFKCYIYLVN